MIIVHEKLKAEAQHVASVLGDFLSIKPSLESKNLDSLFQPIPKFNGFSQSCDELYQSIHERIKEKVIVVLTPKDIYFCDKSQEDDWCFAYAYGNQRRLSIVISTARLKGKDSKPIQKLEIPKELYYERLKVLALHELGHDIVSGKHLRRAFWVNAETGYQINTHKHCPNNNCVFYQLGDIQTPDPKKGYMRVGRTKKFDTGLDDLISRLGPDYFCDQCMASMKIGRKYK